MALWSRPQLLVNGSTPLEEGPRTDILSRISGYSLIDLAHFVTACSLARKVDASIDVARFQEIVGRHKDEGYDSYKYFNKRKWLIAKLMRAIELELDKCTGLSVLDIGCGAGYFLYACKWLGHEVRGIDLPTYDFYNDMMGLFGISRLGFRIEPFKKLPNLEKKFDVVTAHQICFNGHKTPGLWGAGEWKCFLDDVRANYLKPMGTIALEFNEEPAVGFYSEPMRSFFSSIGAQMYRGRVLIQAV